MRPATSFFATTHDTLSSQSESTRARRGPGAFGPLIGAAPCMQKIFEIIEKLSVAGCSVVITGESGTGKELVARTLHLAGERRDKPFMAIDCAALTPSLVESELFGHVRGAFTDARDNQVGLLEAASDGTILLDEVGELPMPCQAKLLRVLQEREIRPLGSTRTVPLRARVLSATNVSLEAFVDEGRFRQDLYFRLGVVSIAVPPLRERKTDIPLILDHFLSEPAIAARSVGLCTNALRQFTLYDWPGNVRELSNALQYALALTDRPILDIYDFPLSVQMATRRISKVEAPVSLPEVEREAIFRALHETRGHKLKAARILGIGKTTLYRKLREYVGRVEDLPQSALPSRTGQ